MILQSHSLVIRIVLASEFLPMSSTEVTYSRYMSGSNSVFLPDAGNSAERCVCSDSIVVSSHRGGLVMGLSLEFQEIWVQISSSGTSLVAQWLRIRLAMQGMQVRFLFGQLRSHVPGQLSLPAAATEPTCPGAQAQVESPCPKAEDHTDSTRTPHTARKT